MTKHKKNSSMINLYSPIWHPWANTNIRTIKFRMWTLSWNVKKVLSVVTVIPNYKYVHGREGAHYHPFNALIKLIRTALGRLAHHKPWHTYYVRLAYPNIILTYVPYYVTVFGHLFLGRGQISTSQAASCSANILRVWGCTRNIQCTTTQH